MHRIALSLLLLAAPSAAQGGGDVSGDFGSPLAVEPIWTLPLDARIDFEPEEALRHSLHDGGLDCTGDGVPDLLFGGEETGIVRLLSGADLALVREHAGELASPGHGSAVALIGDADGDARADYAIGHPSAFGGGGRVSLHSGADGSLLWQVDHVVDGLGPDERFGAGLSRLGDIDGDGAADVLVAAPGLDSAIVLSGADGSELLSDTDGLGVGHGAIVGGPGDFDLDGTPDLLVGANDVGSTGSGFERRLRVVSGAGGEALFERQWLKHAGDNLGSWMGTAGDWNLDGAADVVALEADAEFANSAVIHAGPDGAVLDTISPPPGGFLAAPDVEFLDAGAVGDIDGDGIGDLAIGTRDQFKGGYLLVRGGSGSIHRVASFELPLVVSHASISPAGDLDGDGRAETLLGLQAALNSATPSQALVLFGGRPWTVGQRMRFVDDVAPGETRTFRVLGVQGSTVKLRVKGKGGAFAGLSVPGQIIQAPFGTKSIATEFVLDEAAEVLVHASNPNSEFGKLSVTLDIKPPKGKGNLSAPAGGQAAELLPGQKVDGNVLAGVTTSLLVQAQAGTRLDIKLRRAPGSALEPELALVGPLDGPGPALPAPSDLLAEVDVKQTDSAVVVKQLVVPVGGTWRLEVTGVDDSAGDFRLVVKARASKGVEKLSGPGAQPGS